MSRRSLLTYLAIWLALALAVAAGVLAGSLLADAARAASRPAQLSGLPHPPAASTPVEPDQAGRASGPDRYPTRSAALAAPVAGAAAISGIASFVAPGYGATYLALPGGAGQRATICGPSACITRTSTDAGPDRAMQRRDRIVDLSYADWGEVCGLPHSVGLCRVTVSGG